MSRLILTLTTQREARCPQCQQDLRGDSLFFIEGIAFCHDCSMTVEVSNINLLITLRDQYGFHDCFTACKGLCLFTPGAHVRRNMAAWLQMTPEASIYGRTTQGMSSWERTTAKRNEI